MTRRERLGLDLAREIVRFANLNDSPVEFLVQALAHVLACDLDDDTMEALRGSFAARNARAQARAVPRSRLKR